MHKVRLNNGSFVRVNGGAIPMKVSDFHFYRRMDLRALLATHLRMIHKLGVVNQQPSAENRGGTIVLKVQRVV